MAKCQALDLEIVSGSTLDQVSHCYLVQTGLYIYTSGKNNYILEKRFWYFYPVWNIFHDTPV